MCKYSRWMCDSELQRLMRVCTDKQAWEGLTGMKWSAPATLQVPHSFVPYSCMTHKHASSHKCVCLLVFCPQSCPVHIGAERGMHVLCSPCLSSPHLRSCCLVTGKQTLLCSVFRFISSSRSLWLQFGSPHRYFHPCSLHMFSPHPTYLSQVVFQPPQVWCWAPCTEKSLLPPAFSFLLMAVQSFSPSELNS